MRKFIMDENCDGATVEELLTAVLWRLRAMHLAILDPAEGRRQLEIELAAAEKRRLDDKPGHDGAELH